MKKNATLKQKMDFARRVIDGDPPCDAYRSIFGGDTLSTDTIRVYAARMMKDPLVSSTVSDALDAMRSDAIRSAVWTVRASIACRIDLIKTMKTEIARRRDGLDIELQGIDLDDTLSDAEKMTKKGQAMQKSVIKTDDLRALNAIFDSIDHLSGFDRVDSTCDGVRICITGDPCDEI